MKYALDSPSLSNKNIHWTPHPTRLEKILEPSMTILWGFQTHSFWKRGKKGGVYVAGNGLIFYAQDM